MRTITGETRKGLRMTNPEAKITKRVAETETEMGREDIETRKDLIMIETNTETGREIRSPRPVLVSNVIWRRRVIKRNQA